MPLLEFYYLIQPNRIFFILIRFPCTCEMLSIHCAGSFSSTASLFCLLPPSPPSTPRKKEKEKKISFPNVLFSAFVNRNTHWWCQSGNTAAGFLTPVPMSTTKMLKPKIVLLIKKLKIAQVLNYYVLKKMCTL